MYNPTSYEENKKKAWMITAIVHFLLLIFFLFYEILIAFVFLFFALRTKITEDTSFDSKKNTEGKERILLHSQKLSIVNDNPRDQKTSS
mgnify:CR=1 FL=1